MLGFVLPKAVHPGGPENGPNGDTPRIDYQVLGVGVVLL